MELEKFSYDNRIVRNFAFATMLWGVVGMLVGLLIATQLFAPELNFSIPFFTASLLLLAGFLLLKTKFESSLK
ncbi:MAG: hypothetical protein ACK4UV_01795 [Ignavibacterium sp.]